MDSLKFRAYCGKTLLYIQILFSFPKTSSCLPHCYTVLRHYWMCLTCDIVKCVALILGIIYQRRPVKWGGGSEAMWKAADGVSSINRTSTNAKDFGAKLKIFCVSKTQSPRMAGNAKYLTFTRDTILTWGFLESGRSWTWEGVPKSQCLVRGLWWLTPYRNIY